MNILEKEVLTVASNNLKSVGRLTVANNDTQAMHRWIVLAKQSINDNAKIIDSLLKGPAEMQISKENIFEILAWLEEQDYLTDSASTIYSELKDKFNKPSKRHDDDDDN